MKKKLIILFAVLVTIGVIGYTSVTGASTNNEIDKSWTFTTKKLDHIQLIGAEQDVNVIVEQTENEETTIHLEGKVSDSTSRNLNKVKQADDALNIELSSLNKVRVMATNEGKDVLTLIISLAKDATIDTFKIDSALGNVKVTVPNTFNGKYKVDTRGYGETEVPETTKETSQLISVETMGDITIKR